MLSYRHAYHAGNHADILKHATLCLLLEKLTAKPTPCAYIDTHAGAGRYNLNNQWSQQTAEFKDGIERLVVRDTPKLLKPLVNLVAHQRAQQPGAYPGSPAIAQQLLREQDKMVFMELHNNEIEALKRNFPRDNRISFHHRDGFEGLPALTPPAIARGLVLVDPSYEVKTDYERTASSVSKASARWSTGIFAVWYPLLAGDNAQRAERLLKQLKSGTGDKSLLTAEMWVKEPSDDYGMHGSGMAIVNPPWQLDIQLQELLPQLAQLLAQNEHAGCRVEWLREKA